MSTVSKNKFRDKISTIDDKGNRSWIYVKKISGKFFKYRTSLSWFLIAFLVVAPFIKVKGHQFLMFNVLERRFNIFGFPFWPQDFHLFVISMIIAVVFVALFTVAFGRLFCGWVCPQTIFLEMVFRRIEYWIEGDKGAQIRLDKEPWHLEKIRKKLSKWMVFFVISFFIANVFLAYLIGGDKLIETVTDDPQNHTGTLISLLIFTGLFYFVFAWFREQVCIIACPYGRLQGVLLDDKSIVVAYDYKRGEKEAGRGKFKKNEDRIASGKGDCIDCFQCVHVCPTGIDIRNGTQLECVNCTACIDACDEMMTHVGLPNGLIRYTSELEISKNEPFRFTNRMKGYSVVLILLFAVFVAMLVSRSSVEANLLRLPGQLYQRMDNDIISNVFTYKIINKTMEDIEDVHFVLPSGEGIIKEVTGKPIHVSGNSLQQGTLFIQMKESKLHDDKMKLKIDVYSGNKKIESTTTTFMGPRRFQ
ncbi:MAG: cytochrome c oxidase accessory protein CcoG [Flavobacteriaceae bacterium]|nr:cytochrome c oxidase accessory protein CcoG [Flavobacteriaceae bacterium]MDZ4148616.1 cytochrome c oxidase accessory protein CcoG [Flavobacteriaceae bacterium]